MIYILVMHTTNIQSLDLNLLIALQALLEEKHITRAAMRIGLSQPAMSRALARLREALNDPLLVRSSEGLTLSIRAQELYPHLLNVFANINQLLTPANLVPENMQGEIVIATRDNEMVTILPKVINHISKKAPGLNLRVIPLIGDDLSPLMQNKVDFIITGTNTDMMSLYRTKLYQENFVCMVAANNPAARNVNLEKFIAMNHCLVSITGFGTGRIDKLLAQKGLKRRVSVIVPHFLAASYIVATTDLIITLPRKIANLLSDKEKFKIIEPPLKIPSFAIYLYWHERHKNNAIHMWLRKVIRECSDN